MLKSVIRAAAAFAATAYVGAVNASAACLLGILCIGGEGGGDPPPSEPPPSYAPEIDATHGLAALALLLCIGLLMRERFLRAARSAG